MKPASRLAVLTALLFCALPALQAQENTGFFRKIHNKLTTFNKVYDTTYVYQVDLPRVVSPTADLIWTGVQVHRDIFYTEETNPQNFDFLLSVETNLARQLYEKAGVRFSYGSLTFGYTFELDRHGTVRNKYNNFSFVRPRFGVSFQYYKVHDYLAGTARIPDLADLTLDFESTAPGQLRHLVVDGFYFFNPGHFSYLATTGRNVIQRRSGGSWMASVCYTQGEYKFDLADGIVHEFPDHIGKFQTGAVSLGGGYSFNWVPYHRDARGVHLKGFRNLTINVTCLPRASLYNHLFVTEYDYPSLEEATRMYEREFGRLPSDEELNTGLEDYRLSKGREDETARDFSFFQPRLNLSAHVGFIYSWDRYFICATADFDHYGFRPLETVTWDEDDNWYFKTVTWGNFYDITARIQFNIRF